jgi:Uroporphyrinogen decarboxylase (URO-D)
VTGGAGGPAGATSAGEASASGAGEASPGGPAAAALLAERVERIRDAVALRRLDRVPVLPVGDVWTARAMGVPVKDFCADPFLATRVMIDGYTSLGVELDGIQIPNIAPDVLGLATYTKVLVPGRDLPDDAGVWQLDERERMSPEDYDRIVDEGFGAWRDRYLVEKLDDLMARLGPYFGSLRPAIAAWEGLGVPVMTPFAFSSPYDLFCGARSIKEFMLDLHRRPDRVQAAIEAAMPVILGDIRGLVRAFGAKGAWVACARGAGEFLRPELWQRLVWPYLKQMVEVVLEEGAIPLLHFDSDWTRDLARFRDLPKGRCILALDGKTDIFKAKELLGDHVCLLGDIPARMFTLGTPEEVRAYASRLVRELGPEGFILGPGCSIPPDARPGNVRAMYEAAQA